MANKEKDRLEAEYKALADADPVMQEIERLRRVEIAKQKSGEVKIQPHGGFQNGRLVSDLKTALQNRFEVVLTEHGIKNDNYAVFPDKDGFKVDHQNWYERNEDWVLPLIAGGAFAAFAVPAIIGSIGSGAGAAGAGAGAGTGAGAGAGTAATTGSLASVAAPTAAGGAAAGGGAGFGTGLAVAPGVFTATTVAPALGVTAPIVAGGAAGGAAVTGALLADGTAAPSEAAPGPEETYGVEPPADAASAPASAAPAPTTPSLPIPGGSAASLPSEAAPVPGWTAPTTATTTGTGTSTYAKMLKDAAINKGIDVVGGLISAKMANSASDKAAAAQLAANEKALALQKEMYEQSRADFAPYREGGARAMGTLTSLMGLGGGGGGATPQAATPLQMPETVPGTNFTIRHPGDPEIGVQPGATPPVEAPGASQQLQSGRGGPIHTRAQQQTASSMAPQRMRAPDGSIEDVPAEFVQHFEQAGAVRV